jgi:hypothetical protein
MDGIGVAVPKKRGIYFRYDPAVLIVSVKWRQTHTPFARELCTNLHIQYTGHEHLVSNPWIP